MYGKYPYQYNQRELSLTEEPQFILVSPKLNKNIKPKITSTTRQPPLKLVEKKSQPQKHKLKTDIKLIKAVQQPNSKFVVEKYFMVPGKGILAQSLRIKLLTLEKLSSKNIPETIESQKNQLRKEIIEEEEETSTVKVESIGMTAADQPIPDYSGYFPRSPIQQAGSGNEATLILEPNSRAVSGNDGTSISSPVSRAVIRKGTAVKVLFRPQSVAISGSNGISHAQADLLVDFIEDE